MLLNRLGAESANNLNPKQEMVFTLLFFDIILNYTDNIFQEGEEMKPLILLVLTLIFSSNIVFAASINFFTHSLKGQTYVDKKNELRGKKHTGKRSFNIELVREMMIKLKHSRNINELPFKRGLIKVQKNINIALFNVSRTPERENSVKWVGPLQKETDYFYEIKNNPTGIKTLEDAKKVKNICVMLGSIHETILRENNFTNINTNHNYIGCFKMLKAGRVDLTPKASMTVLKTMERAGLSPDKVQQTPVILLESGGYIAFSKNIPDEIIKNWQDALDHIKKSGKYQQIYNQYYLFEDEQ